MFEQVDDRDEPFLLAHPDRFGVLAWWDHRSYTLEWPDGRIELFAATVGADVSAADEVLFPHARCIAGTSMLHAAPAGTNVLLIWLDERHGGGILDPRPEIYFETIWL
jgi:hypothetical protein